MCAFVLEMDREASHDHLLDIFTTFSTQANLQLVLINSQFDDGDMIKLHFMEQNLILATHHSIRVDNLFGIDVPITEIQSGDTTSIQKALLPQIR